MAAHNEEVTGMLATPATTQENTNATKIIAAHERLAGAMRRTAAKYATVSNVVTVALIVYFALGVSVGFALGGIAK